MAAAALCISLVVCGIILPRAHGQEGNAVLQVVPNKLQFFEYDTVSLHCEGLRRSSDWKFVRRSSGRRLPCSVTSTPSTLTCAIRNIYKDDGGEYWCNAGAENRTNSVVITVTAGSVILESPALPVMEGDDVTLRCRNKTTSSSNFETYFYKDGVLTSAGTTGHLMIRGVSKSDEGLYKCNISGAGESAENWLNVTGCSGSGDAAPWIVITTLVAVLLIMLGIHHFVKRYWHREPSAVASSVELYAAVQKNRRSKDEDGLSTSVYCTLDSQGDDQDGPGASAAVTNQPPQDDFYTFLQ